MRPHMWTRECFRCLKDRRARVDDVAELIDVGADVNAKDEDGRTPLHYAVGTGGSSQDACVQIIWLLLGHHADVNARDNSGVTPLILAAITHDVSCVYEIIEALLDCHADVNAEDETGRTTLSAALRRYSERSSPNARRALDDFVCLLVRGGLKTFVTVKEGYTPLHIAAQYRLTLAVALLVDQQADVNATSIGGNTPLHLGLRDAWYPADILSFVRLLHDHGADVDRRNNLGSTPLCVAVTRDYSNVTEVVQLLIEYGADVFVTHEKGRTLLHDVAARGKAFTVARLLLNHLPDVNVKDGDGNTPLHLACSRYYDPVSIRRDMIEFFLDCKAEVNTKNDLGETPLHRICCNRNFKAQDIELVELLANRGADPFAANRAGDMLLFDLMKRGNWKSVEILLDRCKSFSVNVKDPRFGYTPLSIMVRRGDVDSVSLLVERGADMNILDGQNMSPFLSACEVGTFDMIYRLIRLSPHHLRPQLR